MAAESALLNHYKIDSLNPAEWPVEKDLEDSSDEEVVLPTSKHGRKVSRSRYSVLESPRRTSVPGAERTKDGVEHLVQKDEPDPLGSSGSVIQSLRRQGLKIEDDSKMRNRFLLSSTTFSPAIFLAEVHTVAATDDLLQGLEFLSRSIEKKSASLKVLVESNFERFVRAKATIDNVYREMINPGQEGDAPPIPKKSHSRQSSRQSAHFRKPSQSKQPAPIVVTERSDKRKNALTKEQEYGVLPIKLPLLEAQGKADQMWGPALGAREREEHLRAITNSAEKIRNAFEIGPSVADCIKRRDLETLVEEYVKAKRLADEARVILEAYLQNQTTPTDSEVFQLTLTSRMWSDVEEQVENFKRDVWRKLAGTHFTKQAVNEENRPEEHMELIGILLELGVEDNPIWVWLLSRYDFLKQKITGTFERSKVEIEILRRRLSYADKATLGQLAIHLGAANSDGRIKPDASIDSVKEIELWEHIYKCLNGLLSTQGGVLGDVIEFWETAESFIDGKAQRSLPSGFDGNSRKHHRLSTDGVKALTGGANDLITLIRENVNSFFSDPPTEDLSMLLSPTTPHPTTPKTPMSANMPSFGDSRFKIDMNNLPPPSPRKGDSWEKYAFWPPNANSLSGVHYLSKIMHLVGTAACEMAGLSIASESKVGVDTFKTMVNGVRERSVQAVCAAWNSDCENCKVLEDWTRAPDRPDITNLPSKLMNFEGFLLSNLQKILYISEATKRPGSPDIILPPSTKLLQMVRSQFVGGIYKALNGMKENALSPAQLENNDPDGLITPAIDASSANLTSSAVDPSFKTVRILLTLSNIQALRNDIMPHLIAMFETNFSVKLTDESNSIREVLGQIDTILFRAYVDPISMHLDTLVREGISSPSWVPKTSRPLDARTYVYNVLIALVLVHTEAYTTATPLTAPILKHLLESLSNSLINTFKQRPKYNLPSLMQATLDVEFLAQTLNNYTTDKASNTQSAIYVALDERTDNDARLKLQQELQEMRSILKKLREGTRTEFACFKRQRTNTRAGERPNAGPLAR